MFCSEVAMLIFAPFVAGFRQQEDTLFDPSLKRLAKGLAFRETRGQPLDFLLKAESRPL
jgi:hypothetical protein